jgi:hypothetical protein
MNYWFVWPTGIAIWLAIGWAVFAYFESQALRHDRRKDQITLSFWLFTIGSKFPLSIFLAALLIGLFLGILSTHVLWHYCPSGSISAG